MSAEDNYNRLRDELDRQIRNDKRLRAITDKVKAGKATFQDTNRYSDIVSRMLGDILSKNVGEIKVPLGKEYACRELLRDQYERINEVLGDVQVSVDQKLGIHLNPIKAPFPEERVNAVAHSLEDPTVPEETIERRARSATENVSKSFHDDYTKANAEYRSKAGLKCYLVRDAGGRCCEWCAALEGRYDYASAPQDVFRKHDNCTCSVTYECGRMRQDVWSKKTWEASDEELNARKEASENSKPKVFRNGELKELSDSAKPKVFTPAEAKELERQALEKNPVTKLSPEQAKELEDKILNGNENIQNDIDTAEKPIEEPKYKFEEAKTIEEAQEYAKQFCQSDFMAKNFKDGVDFKGISVENANKINQALTNVFNNVELDKISGIKAVAPNSALGKKAFKDGADAVFAYDPIQHGIYVNKDILKNEKTFADYVKRSEDSWNTVMNNIDKLSGSQKELALTYKEAGRSLVDGNTVEGLFTHELGHHAQWTLLDAKTNNSVGSKMSEYAPKISGYANASKSEYLAESFSAYMKDERNLLDPEYVKFLDEKAIDNGSISGIIELKETSSLKINMQFFAEKDIEKQESGSLRRAMRKYEKRIEEHKEYISNPKSHCPDWESYSEKKKAGYIRHWNKEISNFEESIQNRIDELKKRGEYDE